MTIITTIPISTIALVIGRGTRVRRRVSIIVSVFFNLIFLFIRASSTYNTSRIGRRRRGNGSTSLTQSTFAITTSITRIGNKLGISRGQRSIQKAVYNLVVGITTFLLETAVLGYITIRMRRLYKAIVYPSIQCHLGIDILNIKLESYKA